MIRKWLLAVAAFGFLTAGLVGCEEPAPAPKPEPKPTPKKVVGTETPPTTAAKATTAAPTEAPKTETEEK